MNNPISKTKTMKNLEAAFAGESMANRKYLYFAKIARKLGADDVAELFEKTAESETGHAHAHLELIYPSKDMTVEKILELAIEGERYEHRTMYPGFEATAKEENEQAAVKEFQEQAEESKEHDSRFAAMLAQAQRRFNNLTKVEKKHADAYQAKLDEIKVAGK